MIKQPRSVDGKPKLNHDPVQDEVLQSFRQQGRRDWIRAFASWEGKHDGYRTTGGQYCALLTRVRSRKALAQPGWDLTYDSSRPGFHQRFYGGRKRTIYARPGPDGVEPLIYVRYIPNRPRQLDISEEFKLLFELFSLEGQRNLYLLDESGNDIEAVRFSDSEVLIRTELVRRYQAAKQLHLALFVDSTVIGAQYLVGTPEPQWEYKDDATLLEYYAGSLSPGADDEIFSRLFGKRLIPPPRREESGVWPFERPKRFENFIVAIDDLGRPFEYPAQPDRLNNRSHSRSPTYLTPVYFQRGVLSKYYDHPERYVVEDGYLRCHGLWGIRIDNDHPDYVVALLGDLGRDLPYSEQKHWRSYNIPPAGPMSETSFRRNFLGQFVSATALDTRFKHEYRQTNQAWQTAFGWALFREPNTADAHLLSEFHVPLEDSQSEFDHQVVTLAKLLVDLLNDEAIAALVTKGQSGEKSLGRLERLLQQHVGAAASSIAGPFRRVQSIRSSGGAHTKGSNYAKAFGSRPKDHRRWMEQLLNDVLGSLDSLRQLSAEKARNSTKAPPTPGSDPE